MITGRIPSTTAWKPSEALAPSWRRGKAQLLPPGRQSGRALMHWCAPGRARTGSSSSTCYCFTEPSCSRPRQRRGSILSGLTVDETKSAPPLPRLRAGRSRALRAGGGYGGVAAADACARPAENRRVRSGGSSPSSTATGSLPSSGPEGVILKTRCGLDMTPPFPEIARELKEAAMVSMVLSTAS